MGYRVGVVRQPVGRCGAVLLGALTFANHAAAEPIRAERAINSVMTRALLERAAFLACARLTKDEQAQALLVRGWKLDVDDAAKFLKQSGYPENFIDALAARMNLEKAVPKFAKTSELKDYCAQLGDWKERYQLLIISLPQLELSRILTK